MKKIIPLIELLCLILIPTNVFSFPAIADNTWYDANPSNDTVYTSQVAIGYDQDHGEIMMWNGHLPGGGYPQLNEVMIFDVDDNNWSMSRPVSDSPPNCCTSGGATWHPGENVFCKFGNMANGSHRLARTVNLKGDTGSYQKGVVWIYDTQKKKWHPLLRGQNDAGSPIYPHHSVTYDYDTDIILLFGGTSTSNGIWAFDLYTNTWVQRKNVSNSPLNRAESGLLYDKTAKKYVIYGGGLHLRDLWTYDIATNVLSQPAAHSTTLSSEAVQGETEIEVADASNMVVGGSLVITQTNTAYTDTRIVAINGTTVTISPGMYAAANIGKKVNIYPPTWPPSAYGGKSIDDGGPSYNNVIGISGVYDDINDKCLFFIPRRNEEEIQCWEVDHTGGVTWKQTASSPSIGPNVRAGDLPAVWMHEYNAAAIMHVRRPYGPHKVFYYRYASGSDDVEPPKNIVATVNTDNVVLTWAPSTSANILGYNVYRVSGAYPWNASYSKLNETLVETMSYTDDTTATDGTVYYYRITAENSDSIESDKSLVARTVPKLIWEGCVSVTASNSQTINWIPRDTNVVGYNVYRAECTVDVYPTSWAQTVSDGWTQHSETIYKRNITTDIGASDITYTLTNVTNTTNSVELIQSATVAGMDQNEWCQDGKYLYVDVGQSSITDKIKYEFYGLQDFKYTSKVVRTARPGTFVKINENLVLDTQYTDSVDLMNEGGEYDYKVYAYRVTSVNKLGIESGPSSYWLTIPGAPRCLNWKESWSDDTGVVQLQWYPNPEEKLLGYHVYHMGPAYDYVMTRLTSSPQAGTSYTHSGVTKQPCITYYVTAVDILGQEGIPSDRALVNRNMKASWDNYGYLNDYYIDLGVTIFSVTVPNASQGLAYNTELNIAGGAPPYTVSIVSGALPDGLSCSSDGKLSGIPTSVGTFTFTVQVTDANSQTAFNEFTLTVDDYLETVGTAAPTGLRITTPQEDK